MNIFQEKVICFVPTKKAQKQKAQFQDHGREERILLAHDLSKLS